MSNRIHDNYLHNIDGGQEMGEALRYVHMSRWGMHMHWWVR